MKGHLFLFILLTSLIAGCKDDDEDMSPAPASPERYLSFNFTFNVDNLPLIFNSIQYINDAGNQYSITKMRFYLSEISLVTDSNTKVLLKNNLYVDAASPPVFKINLATIPSGNYTGLSFNIGLDSAQNITGYLPSINENLYMEWPVVMGGGYHFMMFEGHFIDSTGTPGFAMHLGTSASLCPVSIQQTLSIGQADKEIRLSMNINEWFRNPAIYDFNVDGNYIMGNVQAMSKLAANGVDVFSMY